MSTFQSICIVLLAGVCCASQSWAQDIGQERPEVKSDQRAVEIVGTLSITVVTYVENWPKSAIYALETDRGTVVLEGFNPGNLPVGTTLRISGQLIDNMMTVRSAEVLFRPAPDDTRALTGSRTVGVFYISFSDLPITQAQMDQTEGAMYTDLYYPFWWMGDYSMFSDATVATTFELFSFGQLTIDSDADADGYFDIFGPYTVPYLSTDCSDAVPYGWSNSVDTQAAAQGIDLFRYQHRVYILPNMPCFWRGLGQLGCGDNCRSWSTLIVPRHTIAHELGHNIGLRHTSADLNLNGVFEQDELDNHTMMGAGSNFTGDQMTSQHRDALGWFDAFSLSILRLAGNATGTYTLQDLGVLGMKPMAIHLTATDGPTTHQFYISYRQKKSSDLGIIYNYFDPYPSIENKIRIHQVWNAGFLDSRLLAELDPHEAWLFDSDDSDFEVGLWVGATAMGNETTDVQIFVGDTDGDGEFDYHDNCYTVANPNQIDADCDGFGNLCDADFNNDNVVNLLDLSVFQQNFLTNDPVVDLNSDGVVNFLDYPILTSLFLQAPGPAGPVLACPDQ